MKVKYQIFVSSTYKDLSEARNKVIDTILSAYHFPVGMEMFGADDAEQWEIIQETIKGSDYYVIIIGHRYGSLLPGNEISYTEREYDYARELGIPVLAFIRDRDVFTRPDERESDPVLAAKLEAFVQKAQANKMCNFWDNVDKLTTQVALALPKALERMPRTGWVRGNEVAGPEVLAELTELSSENRKLKVKLAEYEKLFSKRMPELSFNFFGGKEIELSWKSGGYFKWPEIIDFERVPEELHEYITRDEVEEYNNNIPDAEKIQEYLDNNNLVSNCPDSLLVTPTVLNDGTSPASDIFVEVVFPDIVKIIWQEEIKGYHHIDVSFMESPVEKARRKHQMRDTAIGRFMNSTELFSSLARIRHDSVLSGMHSLEFSTRGLGRLLRENTPGNITDNVLKISLNKLPHTRKIEIDEIAVVPIAQGEGDIKISVMCSEFEQPLLFTQHIKVS